MTRDASSPSSLDFRRMVLADDAYDAELLANTHPSDWSNPTPAARYNLVVVGAGTAGLVAAAGAAGLGARVALVERALTGGDCLNVGCVPSKAMLRSARAAFDARDAASFGVRVERVDVDFAATMERMRRLRSGLSPVDSAARFRDLGVDVFLGDGRFAGPDAVSVGGAILRFDRALVATGARASTPDVPGLAEAGYLTNETVFTLAERPGRLLVLGSGPIGCELAQAFRRLGSEVTIASRDSRLLPKEDVDVAAIVQARFDAEGIRTRFGVEARHVDVRDGVRVVSFDADEVACDAILCAVGRTPNVEGLGLDRAGVAFDRDGVTVDARLRTTNPRVFASGDVCSRDKFTHAADAMSRLVLRNAFFFGRGKASEIVLPWCTYTDPEVAHVGYYEEGARRAGFDVATLTERFDRVDRAVLDGETDGLARVHYDRKTGRILGGTIVARHAGEMIGELTLAIATRQKIAALSSTIHPYPTQADALRRIGDAYMREKLTPFVKSLFARWFAWRR